MAEVSLAARALARRVLLPDARECRDDAALAEAVARADAQLRARLVDLIGPTGYTTLVARAVRLAQAEVPALEQVTGDAGEGTLRGVRAVVLASDGDLVMAAAGPTAILAHVIGLLIAFIGEDLALRLIHEAWPDLASDPAALEERA